MSNILILDDYRKDITFSVKQRAALLAVLVAENRDATTAEEKRLDELEHAIAYGIPRGARDANAQAALAQEIWEMLADVAPPCGFFAAMDRAAAAQASADRFFAIAA